MTEKILITGINGFIGSHCSNYFKSNGWDVYGIDIYGEQESNFIQGTVSLEKLLQFKQEFDVILHLAGSGSVGMVNKSPESERLKTVKSSEELLEYIQKYNKNAKLIYISSAAVYGNTHSNLIHESDEYAPISEYGKHKVLVENAIINSDINYHIVRLFSVYGEGLKKQVLWDFSNKLKNNINEPVINCFGTGAEERDFIHINDVISLINLVIKTNKNNLIINGGTGIPTTIRTIFNTLSDLFDYKGQLVFDNIISKDNPMKLVANIDNAKYLGFIPQIEIQKGLENYVEWFKEI